MKEFKLGKIRTAKLGRGGYDDSMFGLSVTIDMGGSSVQDFKGFYHSVTPGNNIQNRDAAKLEFINFLLNLMEYGKLDDVTKIQGLPVEVTLEGNLLRSWRVLTEVL